MDKLFKSLVVQLVGMEFLKSYLSIIYKTSMLPVLMHGNINNCDDKMFILVSTLSIMNGGNLTPKFKKLNWTQYKIKLQLEINLIQFEF